VAIDVNLVGRLRSAGLGGGGKEAKTRLIGRGKSREEKPSVENNPANFESQGEDKGKKLRFGVTLSITVAYTLGRHDKQTRKQDERGERRARRKPGKKEQETSKETGMY